MSSPISLSAVRSDALARRDRGDLNGARQLMEQAVEGAAMVSGEDHPDVLQTAHLLASLHRQAGDLSGARRVLENAVNAGVHRHGEGDPLLLAMAFDLGEIADELGNRHEARKHYSKVASLGPAAGLDQQKVRAAQSWLGPVNAPATTPVAGPITPTYQPTIAMPLVSAPRQDPISHPAPGPAATPPVYAAPPPAPAAVTPVAEPRRPVDRPSAPMPAPPVAEPRWPVDQPSQHAPAPPAHQKPPVTYLAAAGPRVERPSMLVPPPTVFTPVPAAPAPPAPRNTAMMAMTIMSALVAVIAATVTVYLLVRPGSDPGGEVADRGPATGLTIVSAAADGEVTLSWNDPSEGEALQVIRYVRKGETEGVNRPISSGVTQQTLPGLNSNWDYCFQVLTIYATDNAHRSEQVCTNRKG